MRYSAKYKLPGQLFWRKAKNLIGDGYIDGKQVLFFEDKRQLHLPLGAAVMFDAKRADSIREKMEQEAGQILPQGGTK